MRKSCKRFVVFGRRHAQNRPTSYCKCIPLAHDGPPRAFVIKSRSRHFCLPTRVNQTAQVAWVVDILVRILGAGGDSSLLGVKEPDTVGLFSVNFAAGDLTDETLEKLMSVLLGEVTPLPLAILFLLLLAHGTLLVLDDGLFIASGIHVTLCDGIGNLFPGTARFESILFFDGSDHQRSLWHGLCVVRVDELLMGVLDLKLVTPRTLGVVDDVLFLAVGIHGGGKGVLLAAQPALAGVIDARGEARAGDNVGRLVELDIWAAGDEALDVQGGEGDEVVLVVGVEMKDGVADLLDVDGAAE